MLLIIVSLSACTKKIVKTSLEEDSPLLCKIPLEVANPSPVYWNNVRFYVVTPEVMQSILDGNTDYPQTLYAMDKDGYSSLSLNVQKILNHIEEARDIIEAYRNYYKKD